MPIDLARSLLFAAGAAMLALAILILVLRPGRGINRALAALVAVRGATLLLPQVSSDPAWLWTAQSTQPYFALATVPLALYCVHAIARLGSRPPGPLAGWAALGAVALLDLAYALDHSLYQTLALGDATVGALQAAPGVQYTSFGPLWLLVGAGPAVLAYLGLRALVHYRHEPAGPNGRLLLLVGGGLTLGGLFDGASRLTALTALLDQPGGFPWLPWGWAVVVLPILSLAPAIAATAVLAGSRGRAREDLRTERLLVALAGFAFFSGFLRLLAPPDSDAAGNALVLVLLGLWRLAMPVLVAFGLGQAGPSPTAEAQASRSPTGHEAGPAIEPLEARNAIR